MSKTPVIGKPMTYSIKSDWPTAAPDVRLVFEGLLCFVFHGMDECQVGIHNTTHGPMPHSHQHDLDLKVWTIESGCGTQDKVCGKPRAFHLGNPKTIAGIQIDVNRPAQTGVYVYQKDLVAPGGTVPHDRDWRWVIEFEKEPLYPLGIELDETKVYPGISINHALFYTLYRTTSTFRLTPDDGSASIPVPSVALLVGGNIYLADGGDVTITIRRRYPSPPKIFRLPRVAGKCHQLDIRNTCIRPDGKRCKVEDYGDKHNDFYLYNETFSRPYGEPEYTLELVTEATAAPLPKEICFLKDDVGFIESSNEAPCGPVSAGGGGGG